MSRRGNLQRVVSDEVSACIWWLRSVNSSNSNNFCNVNTDGSASNYGANYSFGVVLGFRYYVWT